MIQSAFKVDAQLRQRQVSVELGVTSARMPLTYPRKAAFGFVSLRN